MKNKQLGQLSLLLVIVGAINWGLVGVFNYNLVAELVGVIFSGETAINVARVVYALVGAAGLYQLAELAQSKK